MKKINLIARIGLFALVLGLGTMAAMAAGETKGVALADLSGAPVQVMTAASGGDVLYASLAGGPQPAGIYRSDDNGHTWQLVSSGPGVAAIRALAVHPADDAVLYAGTDGGPAAKTSNLWRSDDGGRTWRRFLLSLPVSPDGLLSGVTALAVDPAHPGLLYVGTDGHGVYRFDVRRDSYGYELIGGISFYTAHVKGLVVGPDTRVYALTGEGLFFTDGHAWQELSPPELAVSLAVDPSAPQRLYAGGVSTGIYRSTDGGQTWERVNSGIEMIPGVALRVTALAVDERDRGRVVAAIAYVAGGVFAPGGVYESRDGGYSWSQTGDADDVIEQLTVNRGVIYAATAGGLERYGEPTRPAVLPAPRSLVNPSGIQALILILTAVLAGLVLVARTEWVLNKKAQQAARSRLRAL
jgi:photosystem II stability/assembly factor-like uncharacterized protein